MSRPLATVRIRPLVLRVRPTEWASVKFAPFQSDQLDAVSAEACAFLFGIPRVAHAYGEALDRADRVSRTGQYHNDTFRISLPLGPR